MPNVLRNLRVNEGSLVDEPANPKARVLFFKRGGENNMTMKTEGGKEYPAEAYAYVPDAEKTSTWKLRLWEDPEKKVTASQVGAAVAALGKGYRGNKVEIPDEDLPKVKAKVLAAWKECHPDTSESDIPEVLQKSKEGIGKRLVSVIRKAWFAGEGWDWDNDGNSQKQAHSFTAGLLNDSYSDALLSTASAMLADSIDSILDDPTVVDKKTPVTEAVQQYEQFLEAMGLLQTSVSIGKAGRKISGERLSNLKEMHQMLGGMIADLDGSGSSGAPGEGGDNVIDKSKLPEDVRKYVEGLEAQIEKSKGNPAPTPDPEDIWKGVSPEVRKRMEDLEKRAKDAEEIAKREREERETREFVAKAQAFKGLPVQAEEFGGVLKSIKQAAPEAYEKLEGVLKSADEVIAKGGVFKEVGNGGGRTGDAASQIEQLAKAKVEAAGGKLTIQKARAEVRKENRELAQREREEADA